jgi:pilus assembly protein CpaB
VYLVVKYLHQTKSQYQAELQSKLSQGMVQVVVPTANLPAGTVANGQNMAQRLFPKDLLYPNTVTANDWSKFGGKVLRRPVVAGKPLLADDFNKQEVSEFAALPPPGMRAVTITVDDVNSISGMLRPGDHIDIMLNTTVADSGNASGAAGGNPNDNAELLPVLHRVLVLATGNDLGLVQMAARPGASLASQFSTVTLQLTPQQASELMLAHKLGTFRIALAPVQTPEPGAPTMPMQSGKELLARLTGSDTMAMHGVGPIEFIIGSGQGVTQQVRYSGMAPVAKPASAPIPISQSDSDPQGTTAQLQHLQQLLKASMPPAAAASSGVVINH